MVKMQPLFQQKPQNLRAMERSWSLAPPAKFPEENPREDTAESAVQLQQRLQHFTDANLWNDNQGKQQLCGRDYETSCVGSGWQSKCNHQCPSEPGGRRVALRLLALSFQYVEFWFCFGLIVGSFCALVLPSWSKKVFNFYFMGFHN